MSGLVFEALGAKELAEGFRDSQKTKVRFMRSEAKRGGQRVRKVFIRKDLSGRPGIEGGQFKKGKQVFTFVSGRDGEDISANIGISKGLRTHEEGFTFRPRRGEYLYIRAHKTGRGTGQIVAKVKQVTIPKRTHLRVRVKEMAPEVAQKIAEAGARGVEVSVKRSLERVVRSI